MLEKFLFDNNMSIQLARALVELDQKVEHVREVLGGGTKDPAILSFAAKNDYAILTTDDGIRKDPALKAAYLSAGVGVFFIWQGSKRNRKNKCDYAQTIVKAWPEIKRAAKKSKTPFTKHVGRNGRITNL